MRLFWLVLTLLTFAGPVWLIYRGEVNLQLDWRTANRATANIAPHPKDHPEAIIQVYSASAFNWRKIFGVHTWIAVKPKNATQYKVLQVIGWRLLMGKPALSTEADIPDRYWFAEKPKVILDVRGKKAEELIPKIVKAAADYPYPNNYDVWPGPNSNSFTAYIARQVPELELSLPSNAVGKDYLSSTKFFARAPSGTGFQLSLFGLAGILIAKDEGLEINLLGLVYGISPTYMTLKLPGFGDIGLVGVKK
ncbi:MAG TPA: DUF3750 domain-containing protein [Gammaproteobacteria bacterium]|nr:DUF3750 domain-containing protein [Gammaproteobacteria bacterium]